MLILSKNILWLKKCFILFCALSCYSFLADYLNLKLFFTVNLETYTLITKLQTIILRHTPSKMNVIFKFEWENKKLNLHSIIKKFPAWFHTTNFSYLLSLHIWHPFLWLIFIVNIVLTAKRKKSSTCPQRDTRVIKYSNVFSFKILKNKINIDLSACKNVGKLL